MLLRRKYKPHDENGINSRMWSWQGLQGKDSGRSKTGTGRFAETSRLSARIVEISLQQAERDLTLQDVVPNKVTPGSWPFLGTSIDAPKPARPPVRQAGTVGAMAGKVVNGTPHLNPQAAHGPPREWRRPNFAAMCSWTTAMIREMADYWSGSSAIGSLRRRWKSAQQDHGFSIFRTRILSYLRLAAQHADHVRQRTTILVGRWGSRSARTFQLLTDRVPAGMKILTQAEPLQGLKHSLSKLRMLMARVPAGCAVIKRKFGSPKRFR